MKLSAIHKISKPELIFKIKRTSQKEQVGCNQPISPSVGHTLGFLCMTQVPSKQEEKSLTHWVKRVPFQIEISLLSGLCRINDPWQFLRSRPRSAFNLKKIEEIIDLNFCMMPSRVSCLK